MKRKVWTYNSTQDTLDLYLYFYIACGVGLGLHLLTFCLLCIFYCKIKRLAKADGIPGVSFWRNYLHLYLIYDASIQEDEKGTKRKRKIEREYVSNQLGRQTNMMADFCYTNPTIVPGEELSRRGFSMYCGSDSFNEDTNSKHKDINYGTYHEALSKF
ncbi:uncharacterized protein LOC118448610 [Vespa mandarinia]|uniref:uncharacterized protein LOC118448610 n=1 Tax=Vespa mandarinia TaxID=7446 RepID=UPI00161702A2|nr:uncharacterized protein LOC118448610 [Vespa mandarinia]